MSRLAQLTLHNASANASLHRRKAEVVETFVFNTALDLEVSPVSNQMSSGRCWLFATMNCVRLEMIKTLGVQDFELSKAYLHFFDKLEKANYFLEQILDLYDDAIDSRIVGYLKGDPVGDGGQFSMVANLLIKYGVVPMDVYPESFNTSRTSGINELITRKLREHALILRSLKRETVAKLSNTLAPAQAEAAADKICRQRKDAMMEEIYRVLVIMDGNPPKPDEPFTYEYRDTKNQFKSITMTPIEFLAKFAPAFKPLEQVSLVNDPRREYDVAMTVSRLGNVHGESPVFYVNADVSAMKKATIAQLKAGHPVWFGCDVGQASDTSRGILDVDLFDYEAAFGFKFGMSKADRIDTGESSATHAMVIVAVHLNEAGRPVRWKILNSWGPDAGRKGYLVMSDEWFSEYVLETVIRKEYCEKKHWKLHVEGINEATHVLPPWDPFGALA